MKQTYLKELNFYRTSDMALCSALCCCGYQIEAVNRQKPEKIVFLIKRDDQLDNLIKSYFTHELKVDPLSYFNYLKEIKTRIYNA